MLDSAFYTKIKAKMQDLIKLSHIYMMHAPRFEHQCLCRQIRDLEYVIYCDIVKCEFRYHKRTSLTELNEAHQMLRSLFGLYFELGYFDYQRGKKENPCVEIYATNKALKRKTQIDMMVNEIGAMIGGLIRGLREENPSAPTQGA